MALIFILIFTLGNHSKKLLAGSPEEALQKYLQAVTNSQVDEVVSFLSRSSLCTVNDYREVEDEPRVTLVSEVSNGKTANLKVRIEHPNDSLSSYTETRTFNMTKENGVWKILGMPWPFEKCG